MKRLISSLLAFVTILLFTSSTSTIVRMDMGEPVPGAEILVEQEPDDVPISSGVTDQNGSFSFSFPQGMKIPKNPTIKIKIKLPENIPGLPKNVTSVPCKLTIIAGGKTYLKQITVSTAKSMSGPFSQSLSNIEDNGIIVIKIEGIADWINPPENKGKK